MQEHGSISGWPDEKKLENIEEHISNLVDTFDILRQYNKKLNTNGVFEVTFEKFFRVSGVC